MSAWQTMTTHVFPWDCKDMLVAVFARDGGDTAVLRCHCAEHGALFEKGGGMMSIHEEGLVPYAWREDDTPEPDAIKFPPLWTDYLTEAQS
jgi:hypothetical protein